ASMARRNNCPTPTICPCPTNSSKVRGRIRAAKGADVWRRASSAGLGPSTAAGLLGSGGRENKSSRDIGNSVSARAVLWKRGFSDRESSLGGRRLEFGH